MTPADRAALAARAEAFDRVVTALRAVAALSDDDLVRVSASGALRALLVDLRYTAVCASVHVAPADAKLNAEIVASWGETP